MCGVSSKTENGFDFRHKVFSGCVPFKYQWPNISAFSPCRHTVVLHLDMPSEGGHDHMASFSQFNVVGNVTSWKRRMHLSVHCSIYLQ